jgi:glycosyltransferase involved in cell wall biosynthesis
LRKIAIIEPISFFRGPPNGIHNLIRGLVLNSEGIEWLLFNENAERQRLSEKGQLGSEVKAPLNSTWISKHLKLIRIPKSLSFAFYFIFRRHKFKVDVIHAHRVELGLLAVLLFPRTPLHLFIHNSAVDLRSFKKSSSFWRFMPALHYIVTVFVYRRAQKILTFNRTEFENASSLSSRVVRVQTFFDDEFFFPNKCFPPKDSSSNSNEINIAWLGRLEREKNPELALRIIKTCVEKNLNIRLNVIGYGSLQEKLELYVRTNKIGKYVKFYGQLEPFDVGNVLRSCHMLLQTSKYEGSPTSLIESLACGIAVVSTKAGDPDGVVMDGLNGFVVRTEEPIDFLEPIMKSVNLNSISCINSVKSRSKKKLIWSLLFD